MLKNLFTVTNLINIIFYGKTIFGIEICKYYTVFDQKIKKSIKNLPIFFIATNFNETLIT